MRVKAVCEKLYENCHFGKVTHYYRIHSLSLSSIYIRGSTFFCQKCKKDHVEKNIGEWKLMSHKKNKEIQNCKKVGDVNGDNVYTRSSIGSCAFMYNLGYPEDGTQILKDIYSKIY